MEEVDESRGSQGSYFDKTQNRHMPLLPPTTPLLLVRATRLRIGLRFGRKTVQNHASPFNYTERRRGRGNDVGPTRQRQKQTTAPFQFPFIVLLHSRGAFFNLQPSSPSSTSILVANFIPHRLQLQSSLPTSSFVANFSPRRLQLQPSSPFNFQTPSLFYFLPFSLMPAVCLMQLLPNELVTQIIIHSIKDKPIFHFLNLHKKICGTFRRICDSDEVLLHVSLCDLRRVYKNRYVRSCFERRFREANNLEALCFEGM
jgi:hypothetical protein